MRRHLVVLLVVVLVLLLVPALGASAGGPGKGLGGLCTGQGGSFSLLDRDLGPGGSFEAKCVVPGESGPPFAVAERICVDVLGGDFIHDVDWQCNFVR